MTDLISELIDKQDTFEIVRDQIALILANEVANQQALATAQSQDPDNYKLRVFIERSLPWEQWLDLDTNVDKSPIVNVCFDSGVFDKATGNVVERQKHTATYNIDCYGLGVAADVVAGGHTPGDKGAAFESQRAVRLVRNILMAALNTYLQLRGVVWRRWPQSIVTFQPQIEGRAVQRVVGSRLSLVVEFNELSPQVEEEVLSLVSVDIIRTDDGEVIADADYDYPTT